MTSSHEGSQVFLPSFDASFLEFVNSLKKKFRDSKISLILLLKNSKKNSKKFFNFVILRLAYRETSVNSTNGAQCTAISYLSKVSPLSFSRILFEFLCVKFYSVLFLSRNFREARSFASVNKIFILFRLRGNIEWKLRFYLHFLRQTK